MLRDRTRPDRPRRDRTPPRASVPRRSRMPETAAGLLAGVALVLPALASAFAPTAIATARGDRDPHSGARSLPPIHVSIVMHNEEPPGNPDFVNNPAIFWAQRDSVVAFAQMLAAEGVAFNYQSDWNFLLAAVLYDTGTPSTNHKNLLRYLREDLSFEVDPHAHETQYNYADVARLLDSLGVAPSAIAGGFIADPPEDSKLEYLWQPLIGAIYPDYTWQAAVLWGGATTQHQGEEHLWTSGIWKPRDNEHFLEHDAAAPLPHIGGYHSNWEGFRNLLARQQAGELDSTRIHTQTIMVPQCQLMSPGYIADFREEIRGLLGSTQAGLIQWVGLGEVIGIWEDTYGSQPNLLPYVAPGTLYYTPRTVHDVDLLPNGRLLVTDGGTLPLGTDSGVFEIDRDGLVCTQYGAGLAWAHNADLSPAGDVIISDSGNGRVIIVNVSGGILWNTDEITLSDGSSLSYPNDANIVPPLGTRLITDRDNHRVIEVNPVHNIVWQFRNGLALPYDADRLLNGNTLISSGDRILEVDPAGTVVWEYAGPLTYEEVWVRNPASGVDLYCHIHRPPDFSPSQIYPGLVLIPGGSGTGTSFDGNGQAQGFADAGIVVVHFDPDGRGLSTSGGTYTYEDYNGFLQQDGLRAVFQHLVDLPETDDGNCGMFSSSYGVTMAAGALARYPENPPAKYLVDFEGPHDRTLTAQINGGHVPHDTSDVVFWSEREAVRFMPDVARAYLRIQTEIDHNPRVTQNQHAIALVNGATHTLYGGLGQSLWTRVNDAARNAPTQVYTLEDPPIWLPESEDDFAYRLELVL